MQLGPLLSKTIVGIIRYMDAPSWYAGQTRAGLGSWAEKNLRAQPALVHEVYTPRVIGEDGEPGPNLFGRYVIVLLPPVKRAFSAVNNTRGMHKLLPLYAETPCPLRPGYVERLKAEVGDMGKLDEFEEVTYDYAKDQGIEVTCGEWAGKTASYQYRQKNLAVMLMQMMGRSVVIKVPLQNTRVIDRDQGDLFVPTTHNLLVGNLAAC